MDFVEPMLIGRARPASLHTGVSVEPKLDGWRAQVAVCPDGVVVRTRSGRDVTGSVPHLQRLAGRGVTAIFDGELVAGAGRPDDFYDVAGTLAVRSRTPSFVAFDVLCVGGVDATGCAYRQRRTALEELAAVLDVVVVSRFDGADLDAVFAVCEQLGIEGVVVKDDDSPYRPGVRSNEWRKAKIAAWTAAHGRRRRPRTSSR